MNSTYSLIVIMMVLKYVRKEKKFWGRMTYFVLKDPRLVRPALALKVSRGPHQRSAHLYAQSKAGPELLPDCSNKGVSRCAKELAPTYRPVLEPPLRSSQPAPILLLYFALHAIYALHSITHFSLYS